MADAQVMTREVNGPGLVALQRAVEEAQSDLAADSETVRKNSPNLFTLSKPVRTDTELRVER